MEGKIVYYNDKKGFGFIEADGFEKNLFFHVKDLYISSITDIVVGADVQFHGTATNEKGTMAKKVEVILPY